MAIILEGLSTFGTKHKSCKFCSSLRNRFAIDCNRYLGIGEVSIMIVMFISLAAPFDISSYLMENTGAVINNSHGEVL